MKPEYVAKTCCSATFCIPTRWYLFWRYPSTYKLSNSYFIFLTVGFFLFNRYSYSDFGIYVVHLLLMFLCRGKISEL